MRNKLFKLVFPLSVILALVLIFGSASPVFAGTPAHAEEIEKPEKIEKPEDADLAHPSSEGTRVKVAILDSGIDLDHPDLNVAGEVTFVPGTTSGDDDNGHGTLVAGIVAALNNDIGPTGVAPEVELYSVKVLNQNGDGVMCLIEQGIEWAVENKMDVINISIGSPMNWPNTVIAALENAYNAGIVIVAGAGNGGTPDGEGNNIWAPARYEPVIAVGATDELGSRNSTSSTGDTLELTAPGTNIYSTAMGGGYGYLSQTSASSPYVAGVAARLIAAGMSSNVEVRQALRDLTQDLGDPGWDPQYGWGLISVEAIDKATQLSSESDTPANNAPEEPQDNTAAETADNPTQPSNNSTPTNDTPEEPQDNTSLATATDIPGADNVAFADPSEFRPYGLEKTIPSEKLHGDSKWASDQEAAAPTVTLNERVTKRQQRQR